LGDRADIEGKLRDGHEVGSRRWGRAIGAMRKEAKPEEVAMDELCPYVAMVGMGGCGWGEGGSVGFCSGGLQPRCRKRYKVERFY
jgi:hypothetical protein